MKTNKVNSVFRERDILNNNKVCSFLPKLHNAFADEEYLYLVMEYIKNGNLQQMICNECNHGFHPLVV
jgi:serine/threonine protein kinase